MANISTEQNYTDEIHQACFKGDFESASLLLRMGVNLNVRFEHGQNLLHIACIKNFYGLVQLLIKFGCNEFIKDNFGRTPLHYAALKGKLIGLIIFELTYKTCYIKHLMFLLLRK